MMTLTKPELHYRLSHYHLNGNTLSIVLTLSALGDTSTKKLLTLSVNFTTLSVSDTLSVDYFIISCYTLPYEEHLESNMEEGLFNILAQS